MRRNIEVHLYILEIVWTLSVGVGLKLLLGFKHDYRGRVDFLALGEAMGHLARPVRLVELRLVLARSLVTLADNLSFLIRWTADIFSTVGVTHMD